MVPGLGALGVRDAALDLIYPLLRALSVLRTEVVHPLSRLQLERESEESGLNEINYLLETNAWC